MTTAWAHLPNARHIDAVLAHIEAHPQQWVAAWDAAWIAARVAALDAALGAARVAARGAAWVAAWDAARESALATALATAWRAAQDVCLALVAWDDAGQLMDMPVDAVRTLAATGHHPAVLLLPARLAMEKS